MARNRRDPIDPTQPSLIVQNGNAPQKWRPLKTDVVVLGRARSCDIELASEQVAPVHCVLARIGRNWLLHDCSAPLGTWVNGQLVQETILNHGDEVHIGTFTFTTHFPDVQPPEAPAPAPSLDRPVAVPVGDPGAERSRRNLVRLALSLRRKLQETRSRTPPPQPPPPASTDQPTRQAAVPRDKLRDFEKRVLQLEMAERELAADRDTIAEGYTCLKQHAEQAERELVRRREEVEAKIKKAWELHQRRLRRKKPPANEQGASSANEESACLDRRRRELDAFAAHLRRTQQRLHDQEMELAREKFRLAQRKSSPPSDTERRRKGEAGAARKPVARAP
jgi:hypothetical protein